MLFFLWKGGGTTSIEEATLGVSYGESFLAGKLDVAS